MLYYNIIKQTTHKEPCTYPELQPKLKHIILLEWKERKKSKKHTYGQGGREVGEGAGRRASPLLASSSCPCSALAGPSPSLQEGKVHILKKKIIFPLFGGKNFFKRKKTSKWQV